jgi:hypothetical protein
MYAEWLQEDCAQLHIPRLCGLGFTLRSILGDENNAYRLISPSLISYALRCGAALDGRMRELRLIA